MPSPQFGAVPSLAAPRMPGGIASDLGGGLRGFVQGLIQQRRLEEQRRFHEAAQALQARQIGVQEQRLAESQRQGAFSRMLAASEEERRQFEAAQRREQATLFASEIESATGEKIELPERVSEGFLQGVIAKWQDVQSDLDREFQRQTQFGVAEINRRPQEPRQPTSKENILQLIATQAQAAAQTGQNADALLEQQLSQFAPVGPPAPGMPTPLEIQTAHFTGRAAARRPPAPSKLEEIRQILSEGSTDESVSVDAMSANTVKFSVQQLVTLARKSIGNGADPEVVKAHARTRLSEDEYLEFLDLLEG